MPRWPTRSPDTDRRFVDGLNQGGGKALGALYDAYAESLYDYCLSMVADGKAAADIVHDTFIDAHRRAARMRDRRQLRAWLYAGARRRCLQRGRARGLSWNWASGSAWLDEVLAADSGVSPGELRELVESALGRLDFADQELLLLTLRHGLSAAEIAAVVGQPARRTAGLVAQAEANAETAITSELGAMSQRCLAGRALIRALHPSEAPLELADRTAALAAEPRVVDPADAETGEAGESLAALPTDVRVAPVPGGRRVERAPAVRESVLVGAGGVRTGGSGGSGDEPRTPHRRAGRQGPGGPQGPRRRPGPGRRGNATAGPRRGRRRAPGALHDGADPALALHLDDCEDCGRRDRVTAVALLELAPVPVLPAALRPRVVHTATDSELSGHRADIAARGGNLTPEGMPRQPDVPSPYTRRWLFLGGGAAGALLTAIAAIMLMSPMSSDLRFPFDPRPQPSIGDVRQETSDRRNGGPEALAPSGSGAGAGGGGSQRPAPPDPFQRGGPDGPQGPGRPLPVPPPNRPGDPSDPPTPPPPAGRLAVGETKLVLDRDGETITLTAVQGQVGWTAASDNERVVLSAETGTIKAGESIELRVVMKRGLVTLPGGAKITITDQQGVRQEVTVTWNLGLLG
ncbi:sigma-70 family RNA polymerase sigma factor [Thermomonospora umbrina]|uniref:RNA polymerase sigma factor (Sigma-70 family) n=1 Tax=Thermomonospora umbrina TaxID=111806 RepID=A0A3D9SNF0_9ACTN|nr:sigma-70 family RNA polymerase sigma factor [Thermomonospora umbrina]REE97449.1 RNA polymerase sigma factor (sigma-70 family) [Thermomonospora umbrina]